MNGFGNTRAIFGNRCILGPDLKLAIGAFMMILVPTVLFDALTLPWAVSSLKNGWVIILFALPLECLSLGMFFKTSLSDPGVIPRPAKVYAEQDWHRMIQPLNPAKHQDVAVHGHLFKLKYCTTCCIYRPPRCVHCSVCDNCVSRFDHHCPWVGNCIGARNYRSFISFILATSLYLVVVLVTCPVKFASVLQDLGSDNLSTVLFRTWEACLLTVYSLGFLWFVLGLSGYHSYLISTNQTTYEQIKGYYDDIVNPWNRGSLSNFRALIFQAKMPRLTVPANVDPAEYAYAQIPNLAGVLPTGKVELSTPMQGSANTTVPPASKSTFNSNLDHSLTRGSSIGSLDHRRHQADRVSPAFQTVIAHRAAPPSEVFGSPRQRVRQSCSSCLHYVECCTCIRPEFKAGSEQFAVTATTTTTPLHPTATVSQVFAEEEREDAGGSWLGAAMSWIGDWGRAWSRTAIGRATCVLPPTDH